MKKVVSFTRRFKLLADRNRLCILKAVSNRRLCVSEIASVVKISTTLASKNLTLLEREGLVTRTREGKNVFYELNKEELDKLVIDFYEFLNIPSEVEKIPDVFRKILERVKNIGETFPLNKI